MFITLLKFVVLQETDDLLSKIGLLEKNWSISHCCRIAFQLMSYLLL